jgi:hypothetical protein
MMKIKTEPEDKPPPPWRAAVKREDDKAPPPWRAAVKREDDKADIKDADETPPWKPLADKVEPEFVVISDSDDDDKPPDGEAARRLLAAARRAHHHEPLELGEQPADDPRASVPGLARWEGGGEEGQRLVRLRNYAAVDAEAGGYGLIDRGTREAGVRSLVMHTPSRRKQQALTRGQPSPPMVRPGTILTVRSPLRGTTARLRVRYTTPARYYSPGQRVTTLSIGVDARDWQAFVGTTGSKE